MESSHTASSEFFKRSRPVVQISFAKHADVSTFARIFIFAFQNEKLTPALHPHRVGVPITELLLREGPLEERRLRRKLVGNDIFIKASVRVKGDAGTEKESVVGWASWSNPDGTRRRSIWDWLWSKILYPLHQFLFQPAVASGLPQPVKEMLIAQQRATFGPGSVAEGRKHWYLQIIVVDPDWQGLGIGGALLDWGLERARQDDAAVYLESSTTGFPVYLSKGFHVVNTQPREVNGFEVKIPGMIWEPRIGGETVAG